MQFLGLPGMFVIPAFMLIIPIFMIVSAVILGIWIYKDCKERGRNPLGWLICFVLISRLLTLVVYLIVRKQKRYICKNCNSMIGNYSDYCEVCGIDIRDGNNIEKTDNQVIHISFMLGIIFFLLSIFLLIVTVIIGNVTFTSLKSYSDKAKITTKVTVMEENTNNFAEVSNYIEGNILENEQGEQDILLQGVKMEIKNPEKDNLYINTTYDIKQAGGELVLVLEQDDIREDINIGSDILGEDLKYPLNNFKEGEVLVKLLLNGVKNVKYKIAIK